MMADDIFCRPEISTIADPVDRLKRAIASLAKANRKRELLELQEFLDWMLKWRGDVSPVFPHPAYNIPGINEWKHKF
jgi:hypothetical protein